MPEELSNLEALNDLLRAIASHRGIVQTNGRSILDGMYCSSCGGHRRRDVRALRPTSISFANSDDTPIEQVKEDAPALLSFQCVQCDAFYTALDQIMVLQGNRKSPCWWCYGPAGTRGIGQYSCFDQL